MDNLREEIRKLMGEMDLEKFILSPKISHLFEEIEEIFMKTEKELVCEEVE